MERRELNIVGMSDLHGHLPKVADLPAGDVLCICGDIVPLDIQDSFHQSLAWMCRVFFQWIESVPYEHVVMVAGNHDFILEELSTDKYGNHRKPKRVLSELLAPKKLTLLEDSEVVINGWKFYGSPWIPDLPNWAYYADGDALRQKFNKIPTDVDVLITHAAPRMADYGVSLDHYTRPEYGCLELVEAVIDHKPKLHLFGHVHSGDHHPQTYGGTTYCNVSLKNERYKVAYEPLTYTLTN